MVIQFICNFSLLIYTVVIQTQKVNIEIMKTRNLIASTLLMLVAVTSQTFAKVESAVVSSINRTSFTSILGEDDEIVDVSKLTKVPAFKGGDAAMAKFLQKTIVYPKEALDAKISGKVFVEILIEKDGKISDINILKGLGYGLDTEAERAIHAMPNWIPAQYNKMPVRVKLVIPIAFACPA